MFIADVASSMNFDDVTDTEYRKLQAGLPLGSYYSE